MTTSPNPAPWTQKSAICLDCRTLVEEGDDCGQGGHHTTELVSDGGREQLSFARWDRSLDAVDRLGVHGGYLVASVFALVCAGLVVLVARTDSIMVTLIAMIGFSVLGPVALLVASKKVSMRLFSETEQHPLGAVAPPPLLLDGETVVGEVVAGEEVAAPVSSRLCVAYAIGLHHQGARPSTLIASDAASRGFTIRTDSGDTVEIPAGTVVLHGSSDVVDPDADRLRDYLDRLGLVGLRGEQLIEFQEIRELRLCVGDRVAVHGTLRAELDPRGEPSTYRDQPPDRLLPIGTPQLERLARA